MDLNDQLNEKEYISPANKRSVFFLPLTVLFLAYILFILYELIKTGPNKPLSEIPTFLLLFVLPLIGLICFYLNKKAGWIICALFFMFFTFIAIGVLTRQVLLNQVYLAYQNIIIISVSVPSSIMLSVRSIKKQYRISNNIYTIVTAISFLVAGYLIYSTFFKKG